MARYDHGGGCSCGLNRYCDCGHDRKSYEEGRQALEREAAMRNQFEVKHHGIRKFKEQDRDKAVMFGRMTGCMLTQNINPADMCTEITAAFSASTAELRDYWMKWEPGMPAEPAPPKTTKTLELEENEIAILVHLMAGFMGPLRDLYLPEEMPPTALSLEDKITKLTEV